MGATASSVQDQMRSEHDPNAAFPWWIRFLAKAFGVLGGFVAIFFAMITLLTTSATCVIAALLQLLFGFLTVALEAPFCCMFVDFIEKIAVFSEGRKYWHKAVIYCGMGLAPMVLCTEVNTVLGCALIFASGTVYGFMALGKKADLSAMGTDPAWNANVNQQAPPAGSFGNPSTT